MAKVFMVWTSAGSYDDARWWVDGIYTSKELAEKRKTEVEGWVQHIRDTEPKDKESEAWFNWWRNNEYEDFNHCKIREIELNKNL